MRVSRLVMATLVATLALGAQAQFVNGSFEDPDLGVGAFTTSGINGWSTIGTTGVWNTTTWGSFTDPLPDGDQIGYMNGGASIAQVSGTTMIEGTNTLNFWMGRRQDGFTGDALVEMVAGGTAAGGNIAGGTVVGFLVINAVDLAPGKFQQFSINKQLAANDPLIGQAIGVHFGFLAGSQVDFDRVEVNTVPEPLSLIALGSGVLLAFRRRRKI